jgi:hypothetical protein
VERGWQAIVRDGCGGLGEVVALVDGSTVREQRCLFQTLRTVAATGREDLTGEENKEQRKQWVADARAVSHAQDAAGARERLAACEQTWHRCAPKAVACFPA